MFGATSGLVLNLLVFTGLGVGPCLWLLSGRRRLALAAAIAPVMGFALTAVFGTYLTLLDIPVSRWCLPWILAGLVCSCALGMQWLRQGKAPPHYGGWRWTILAGCGFLVTAGLTVAPWSLGGLNFATLRGDGVDSFNYITTAEYLDREPFSWAGRAAEQDLVDHREAYHRARPLLKVRWATPMMLAFTSRVAGVPAYKFEYLFSVLSFLLAYGPVLLYARVFLKLRPRPAILTALVVCAGFWAQFIIDIRADGQQNSVPILLLIALLIARIESGRLAGIPWKEHALLGISVVALLFFYPEIAPMAACGVLVFEAVSLWRNRLALRQRLLGYLFSLAVVLVGIVPMARFLAGFIGTQLASAARNPVSWHIAYFKWLYTDPFTGVWGAGPLAGRTAFDAILVLPAIVLTAAGIASAARALWPPSRVSVGMTLAASFTFAACLEWAYLVLRNQLWAGAKGLSFGYAFLIFTLVGSTLTWLGPPKKGWRGSWNDIAAACTMVWLLLQCGLALYRPWLALSGSDYSNYIANHGEYRRHDWNLDAFDAVLRGQKQATVWSDLSNPWVSNYMDLALGGNVHLVNIGAVQDFEEPVLGQAPTPAAPRQSTARWPQYLILENDRIAKGSARVVAQNTELSLLQCPADGSPVILSISNPNGIEGQGEKQFFWMGGGPTTIRFLSLANTTASLKARFIPGPSLPGIPTRHLLITAAGSEQRFTVGQGVQEFQIPVVRGLNRVVAEVEEKPAVFLPGDRRPLLLRLDELQIETGAHQAAAPPVPKPAGSGFSFVSGFFPLESSGAVRWRWVSGPSSSLEVSLPKDSQASLRLRIALLPPASPPLCKVSYAGVLVAAFTGLHVGQEISVPLRGTGDPAVVSLEFSRWNGHPDWFAPSDRRPLALAFSSIRLLHHGREIELLP